MSDSHGWNEMHQKYAHTDWIDKPSMFAAWVMRYFPSKGRVLDVGCGQGQDSRFFASKGYNVVAIDFAAEALRFATQKTPEHLRDWIDYKIEDLSQPLSYPDTSFDVVYSHLAVHYFDTKTTQRIFDDFHRVLKPGGLLAVLVNSTSDPEIRGARMLEHDFYQIGDMQKRYFSDHSVRAFANKFSILLADNKGETYKDRAVGNSHLVRLVAKKP